MHTIKVVHVTSVHPPFDIRIFHKECRSLAKAGYEVTLLCCGTHDAQVDGIKVKVIPRASNRLRRMTGATMSLYRNCVEADAGIYHFHDPELIPVGLLLRARGKTVVYDVHEEVAKDIANKAYLPAILRSGIACAVDWIERLACTRFSAVVASDRSIGNRLRMVNGNTVIVQNFTPLEDFPASIDDINQRMPTVIYAGCINRSRCILEMTLAMGHLPESLGAKLLLAGEFDTKADRVEASSLSGWNRVEELGFVDRPTISRLMSSARLGLALYHPDPNYLHASSHKMFEYMAAGIPLIVSNFPSWREIVEENGCGLVVDPLDPRAIANAIEYILTHPAAATEMGRNARLAVEKYYNWDREARELLDLYSRLSVVSTHNNGEPAPYASRSSH